jgi:hypothetical protein
MAPLDVRDLHERMRTNGVSADDPIVSSTTLVPGGCRALGATWPKTERTSGASLKPGACRLGAPGRERLGRGPRRGVFIVQQRVARSTQDRSRAFRCAPPRQLSAPRQGRQFDGE